MNSISGIGIFLRKEPLVMFIFCPDIDKQKIKNGNSVSNALPCMCCMRFKVEAVESVDTHNKKAIYKHWAPCPSEDLGGWICP